MEKKSDYTKELFEIILSLKSNLDNCIQLIKKITDENNQLNSDNTNLTGKLSELEEEMKNYTKVSFVSNLSKQITEKDQQIILLKKKVCKLESDLSNSQINNDTNEDLLVEINANKESNKRNIDISSVKDENEVIHTTREEEERNNLVQNEQSKKKKERPELKIDEKHEEDSSEEENSINEQDEEDEDDKEGSGNEQEDEEEDDNEDDEEDSENEQDDNEGDEDNSENEQEEDEGDNEDDEEDSENEQDDDEEDNENNEEDEEDDESGDEYSDEEEIEFEIKKIGKKKYYVSNELPPGVYSIEEDDIGEKLGNFINNKLVKSA